MKLVGLVGWRGMVGSVLMQRMQEEGDFNHIEPVFFSTSNTGGKAPAMAKNETALKDAPRQVNLNLLRGRIEEITMTYVVVQVWDERRLVLPCTYFTNQPFESWTRKSDRVLGTVFMLVGIPGLLMAGVLTPATAADRGPEIVEHVTVETNALARGEARKLPHNAEDLRNAGRTAQ